MKNTRLFALLSTLSNKERKEVRQFLASPFFNKRAEVCFLFDYLTKEKLPKNRRTSTFSKEEAYAYLLSKQNKKLDYDDQQMRLWMSFLLKLIEKYLVHASFFLEEVKVKTKLAKIYCDRNLPKQFDRNLRDLHDIQEKQALKNAAFYTDNLNIQLEQYRFTSINSRMKELNLQKMSDNLDLSFLSQKLRQSCLTLAHQTVYKRDYHFGLLPEVLQYVVRQDLTEVPAIAVYYHAYMTLSNPKEAVYFPAFKKAILDFGDHFPPEELRDLYLLAINFCIKYYNAGGREYLKDEFELYQKGLEQGFFLKNNTLSRFTYRNVSTVGLVLKEFQWVEQFITANKKLLAKKYQESMYSFCLACLQYSRKNYKEALLLLQKSAYKDHLLNLAAKTVMLKIFYELEEFDLLDSHLEAMRIFIRRKKIIGYHQENYLNLIQFTKKLMERNAYDRERILILRKEIEGVKAVAEKDWLLGQV